MKKDINEFSVAEAVQEALNIGLDFDRWSRVPERLNDFVLLTGWICGRLSKVAISFPEVNDLWRAGCEFPPDPSLAIDALKAISERMHCPKSPIEVPQGKESDIVPPVGDSALVQVAESP